MQTIPNWPIYAMGAATIALVLAVFFGLLLPCGIREWRDLMREIREGRRP